MSVIVEDAQGRFIFLTKGAESSLLPNCKLNSSQDLIQSCLDHITEFAKVPIFAPHINHLLNISYVLEF